MEQNKTSLGDRRQMYQNNGLSTFSFSSQVDHLTDIFHIMESQSFHIIRFDLFYIFLVFLTQDQFLDTCPFGCQNLFLDTTYRKHFSTQCYFAGHRQILHLTLGKSGDKRSDHSHTGTGPVFRYGSLGNVDMNIQFSNNSSLIPNKEACAWIYSSANMADSFITSPRFPVKVNFEPLPRLKLDSTKGSPAYRRPRQPGNNTGIIITLIFITAVFNRSQILVKILRFDLCRIASSEATLRANTHDLGNLLVQLTHTAFTGI